MHFQNSWVAKLLFSRLLLGKGETARTHLCCRSLSLPGYGFCWPDLGTFESLVGNSCSFFMGHRGG